MTMVRITVERTIQVDFTTAELLGLADLTKADLDPEVDATNAVAVWDWLEAHENLEAVLNEVDRQLGEQESSRFDVEKAVYTDCTISHFGSDSRCLYGKEVPDHA